MTQPTQLGPYSLQGTLLETAGARVHAAERPDGALPGEAIVPNDG